LRGRFPSSVLSHECLQDASAQSHPCCEGRRSELADEAAAVRRTRAELPRNPSRQSRLSLKERGQPLGVADGCGVLGTERLEVARETGTGGSVDRRGKCLPDGVRLGEITQQ
jgi:hypothetical protein